MVIDKTGGLFRLAIGLMQSFADHAANSYATHNFSNLLNNLGLYFQIRGRFPDVYNLSFNFEIKVYSPDDLMNISSVKYAENKSFCEDLTEGK